MILTHTFSTTYAMTGWRLGYVVAPPDLSSLMLFAVRRADAKAFRWDRELLVLGVPMSESGEPALFGVRVQTGHARHGSHRFLEKIL